MKEEKDFSFKPYIIFAIIMFIIVISTYTINFYENTISKIPGDWGTFGDFMGGTLNPILAFLSFLALLQTIKIQSKELKKSSKALKLSKKELSKSSRALEEQSTSLKIQNFENTFFNLIDLHNKIIDKLDGKTSIEGIININFLDNISEKENFYSKNSFSDITETLKKLLCLYNRFDSYDTFENNRLVHSQNMKLGHFYIDGKICSCDGELTQKVIKKTNEERVKFLENQLNTSNDIYCKSMKILDKYIGHYLKNIHQILKFIDKSETITNKKFYSNILRAQLSQDELFILFHNCISKVGIKMLPLIIKYEFLEHLTYNEKLSKHDLKIYINEAEKKPEYYPSKAFGKNEEFAKVCTRIKQE